jgi:hypothetical protein
MSVAIRSETAVSVHPVLRRQLPFSLSYSIMYLLRPAGLYLVAILCHHYFRAEE